MVTTIRLPHIIHRLTGGLGLGGENGGFGDSGGGRGEGGGDGGEGDGGGGEGDGEGGKGVGGGGSGGLGGTGGGTAKQEYKCIYERHQNQQSDCIVKLCVVCR